jgi:dTDP-4-amino-4,6-dideoxygalactose transaminase
MRAIRPDTALGPSDWMAAWRARDGGPETALGGRRAGACRFVGSGSEALALALAAAPGALTLLPDYLCPQLTRSLMATGDAVHFFPVDGRLCPEWDWIAAFRPGVPKKVVVVHYYGVVQAIPEALRARDDLTFVEDAAHALWSEGVGRQGTMTAFSFRKFMPVPDGGALLARDDVALAPSQLATAGWRPFASALYLTASWLEARCVPSLRSRLLASQGLAHVWEDASGGPVLPRALSPLGRRLAAAARPDAWARARREHYAAYERLLPADDERLQRLFPVLPAGAVPYGFPVLLARREPVRKRLLRVGVQTRSSWDRLVQGGPDATAVASRILLLPLHQGLDARDVERVALSLRALLEEKDGAAHH